MHTRRTFLTAVGAGLWTLSGGNAWAQAAAPAPSPADVVTQFLAARAAQDYAKAYALLSLDTLKQIDYTQFTDTRQTQDTLKDAAARGASPLMVATFSLFADAHNTVGYTFTVVGPDPADPHTVLVNALPPVKSTADATAAPAASPLVLHIVTTPNAQGAPRLEMQQSFLKTSPVEFGKAREDARMTASLSNLKQLSLSMIMYMQDHSLRMPDAAHWTDLIYSYVGSMSLLHDPSAPDGQTFSYAFNRSLSGISLSKIAQPAETVLLFTSTLGTKNAADTGQSLPKPGWHTGGNIVAFADGHVQWVKDDAVLKFTP